jgi:signal transduction histidine kinase
VRRGEIPIAEEVAAMRRREMTAAFGLLALLATSIALLTVVTRRTQRAARQQFEQLARVSHELRTPLSVLTSAGDNLADGLASGEEKVRQYGQVIRKETRRLRELVENVLHLARRRAGAPPIERQLVDVVELIEDSVGLAEPSLREAGFTVERALPAHAVPILGEPRALRSALLNLISNAVKYGRAGRWLRLAVEQDGGAEVRIVVEDRGPGIAAAELPRLFAPYARGRRAVADQMEGTGLGLAVVKDVVESHAGRIAVASPTGGGTAFILHFPLAQAG